MSADKLDHFAEPDETLYEFVTRLASATAHRTLAVILAVAVVAGIAFAALSLRLWPLVAACGTIAAIAGWGLLEHWRVLHPRRWIRPVEGLLVFLGGTFALIAAMGALYTTLGASWIS